MKLQCQVDVINRTHCNINMRTNSKYVKSTLALGKEPKCETEFFILHFSTVNKSGTKYRVKHIKQVFVKCINDGKSTLRFEEPPHDLCIKSESIQLKCFMKLLKSCLTGDPKALQLSSLTSLSVTAKDNAPTKLVIRDRSEFPSKGLPRTLENLCLSGLKLCNFRRDILLMKQLTVLNLSDNEIEKLPPEFGRLPSLTELYLGNNQIGGKDQIDWRWLFEPQLSKTLKLLDLSGNKLTSLPRPIWKLQKLVTLKLDNNQLKGLPSTIGRMSSLRYLTVSKNSLETLPCAILHCKLEHIDISGTTFHRTKSDTDIYLICHRVDYLVNIAAKVVLKHKFFYAPNIIPRTLVHYLDDADMCICGAPVFNKMIFFKDFELKDYFREVVCDGNRRSMEFNCCVCSRKCLIKYANY